MQKMRTKRIIIEDISGKSVQRDFPIFLDKYHVSSMI